MMRGKEELVDLCSQLRGEKLIVSSEIDQICRLNNDVVDCLNQLMQTAWISCKQQLTVNKLMQPSANPTTPRKSCRQVQALENTQFLECYKKLNGHDANLRQLIQILLSDSSLLTSLLNFADSCTDDQCLPYDSEDLCHSLFSGLYGCCIFGSDEKLVADTLLNLMRLQLVTNQDPRRLLRRGNCSFSRLYKLFNENMFAAKVFLTCALHEPIMDVLSMDDAFLDIDPNKILERLSPLEKMEKFGEEGAPKFKENVNQYRKMVVNKLFTLSQKFITSLKSSLHCFPPVISLLVRRLIDMLLTRQEMESSEDHLPENAAIQASLISIDLIFTYFICPAIAKPESLAIITDTPISSIARHNLMQIGQILQSLAVSSYEKLDPKYADLFSQFEPTCVSSIVQTLTAASGSSHVTLDELYASGDNGSCNLNIGRPSITRQIALVTIDDVDLLMDFLRKYVASGCCEIVGAWKEVSDLLNRLPARFSNDASNGNAMQVDSNSPTNAIRKTLKLPRPNSRTFNLPHSSSGDKLVHILQKDGSPNGQQQTLKDENSTAEVLIVHLSDNLTPLQMEFLSEESFLASIKTSGSVKNEGSTVPSDRSVEKRTRFDLDSLGTGNSDQLNASSDEESVSSSIDALGNQDQVMNDNFSDVDALPISADVSGRGSPNISGRDTPLSVHTEQPEDGVAHNNESVGHEDVEEDEGVLSSRSGEAEHVQQQNRELPPLPTTSRKENRADIEEKFFKFEIPQPTRRERHRDETHSLVSDSWSTDVLASESEFGVEMQMAQQQQQQGVVVLPDLVPGQPPEIPRLDLIAEEVVVPVTRSTGPTFPPATSVTSSVPVSGARAVAAFLENDLQESTKSTKEKSYGAPCDRSDTWSVDATASDSDADAMRTDDRMKEFDDVAGGGSGSGLIPSNTCVSYGSSSVVSDAASVPCSTAKMDERRHSMAAFPGLTISPAEANDLSTAGRSTPVAIVNQKCDVRRCESLIPSTSGVGLSLANVQSTTTFGSQFRGGASSSNWSEMSTVGSFSQQSVTFSDDSSDAHCGNSGICPTDQLLNDSLEEKSPTSKANLTTTFENQSLFKDEGSPNRFDIVENMNSITENASMESSPRRRKSDSIDSKEAGIHKRASNKQLISSPANAKPHFIPNSSRTFDHIFDKDDKRRNFLKTFKLSNLKSKVKRSTTDHFLSSGSQNNYEDTRNAGDINVLVSNLPRATSLEFHPTSQFSSSETGDQILAKYRRSHPQEERPENAMDFHVEADLLPTPQDVLMSTDQMNIESTKPYYDPSNVINCQAFLDVKRKLRLVLSSINVGTLSIGLNVLPSYNLSSLKNAKETELVQFLNVLLAEALNTSDKILSSQLREVLRCLSLFDAKGIRKLVRALHEEHRHRSAYVAFLQQSRLNMLQALSYLEKLIKRIFREKTLNREWLIEFCARLYLDQNCEKQLREFTDAFRALEVQDERTDFVERFLTSLYRKMMRDEMWHDTAEDQLKYAKLSAERYVMALIYAYAFYPNGEADISRDKVFFEAIKRLSLFITPSYKGLQIPVELHGECPWPLAQAEISIINAYKTPRDRLGCVLRCCETIVNLLRVSRMGKTPSADDIIPVLVFVLVKANPPALLSTVQYINGFYGRRLQGEEAYWWTQFCAAVEFIKVMVNTKE